MDEVVTDDQRAVLDETAKFAAKECPVTRLRDGIHRDPDFRTRYWRQGAELGWFSMLVAESLGGGSASDNGVVDATLIASKLGAALQPGPYVATNVAAYALAAAGSDQQKELLIPALLSGEGGAVWVAAGGGGQGSDAGVRATPTQWGYELRGHKSLIQDIGWASWILVTAASADGPVQFMIPVDADGVSVRNKRSLDLTRDLADVEFTGTPVRRSDMVGDPDSAARLVSRQLALASVLTAAQTTGAVSVSLDRTIQYAKDRIAFGRPIGSFQAIKHLLVDSSLSLELGQSVVMAAADALGRDDESGDQAASMAKALVGDAGIEIASNCTQVLGGIGLTWEHDQHLFVRRVTTDAALFGDPVWHRERVCQLGGI
ncbi:acyl-CoA dehydrogenase family protein [Mycolicibacterium vinylchloridicum]|uniref:acyl-CoA dehydrogenase family protein n=1 Tax=Mycolicibacterium vinylchloridicum TaxID=2736928 RepID=UPI001C539DEE|nr:acyl-CoA dehydrogenase family protein [Mycolicibacterium vinylchloridicum]